MGSRSTTENKIPAYMEEAGKLAVEEAKKIKEMGYLPYFGPEVAAINPYEQAMAQNVGGMASAFGMAAPAALDMSGVDTATSGGLTGYTTAPAYFSALERLRETRPDQYEFFAGLGRFDPITGVANPNYNPNPTTTEPVQAVVGTGSDSEGFPGSGYASVDDSFYDPNEFDPLGPTNIGYSIDIGDTSIPIGPQHGDGEGGGGGKSIVCTEMYRQTKLDDWSDAMKTWYVYQKKHLTPYHEIGYHAVFKPFVLGMKKSKLITKIGAYAAKKRTKHLRYVLTKGKSKSSFVGKVICSILEPQMYLAGRVVSAIKGGS
jgi:hypothetical protein